VAGMGVTDIVSPILGAGRTMAMNNFQYINPINIYKKLQNVPSISEQFQIPTGITDTGLAKTIKGIFENKTQTDASGVGRTVEGVDEDVPAEQQPSTETNEVSVGKIVFIVISSVLAVGAISFVINDMIMHPFMSRLAMTLVLIVLVMLNPLIPFVIILYYFVNAMWKYYINTTLPETERKRIIPYIYGFLPLTTSNPKLLLGRILLAPFHYNPDTDMENMKWDRKEWLKSILGSFPNAKETLSIGGMNALYKQYTESLGKIHEFDRIVKVGDTETVERLNPFTASPQPPPPAPSKPQTPEPEKPKTPEPEPAKPKTPEPASDDRSIPSGR
jgi:hypothetical protein